MKPSNPSPHLSGMEKGNKHTFAGFWTVILTFMHSLCVSLSLSHTHTHAHTHTHTQTTILLHSLVTHHQIVSYLDPCKRRWLACLSSHCRGSSSSLAHSNLDTNISHITHTNTHTYKHAHTHACMYASRQERMHTHMHAYTHTHTHTHAHTQS